MHRTASEALIFVIKLRDEGVQPFRDRRLVVSPEVVVKHPCAELWYGDT
jgi:hypothetical protein